jgi:hypothetical protein
MFPDVLSAMFPVAHSVEAVTGVSKYRDVDASAQ